MRRDIFLETEREDMDLTPLIDTEDFGNMEACCLEAVCGVDICAGSYEQDFFKEMYDDYEIECTDDFDSEIAEYMALKTWGDGECA